MTRRTILGSLSLVLIVFAVIALLSWAVARQQATAARALESQEVIAAANLTQQRLLAVQTNVRGYLISGNEELLQEYQHVRSALPDAATALAALVADDPEQARRAARIRDEALSYVNNYAENVVTRTRQDGVGAGREFAAAASGTQRAKVVEDRIAALSAAEQIRSVRESREADAASERASRIALVGLLVCVLALAIVTFYVARRIARPVSRLAVAADRVRSGDLDATVPTSGRGEIGRLAATFNAMARSLQQSRDELEHQNTELEMQAIALEERQEELTAAGEEVRAQRDELSLTAAQLAEEKRRAEAYGAFADSLAAERDARVLAWIALSGLVEAAGADVGALYGASWAEEQRWARLAAVGLDPEALAERMAAGGEGAAARAVLAREVVLMDSSALRVQTLGGEAPVRWELHVPLQIGERSIGVATLGGISSDAFDADESELVLRLAAQAATALAEADALAQQDWLSQVNAAVLDGVREGIGLVGLDGELVFANAAMAELAARADMPVAAAIGADRGPLPASFDGDTYFADWEAVLADSDEPTADELAVSGFVLERYTAPIDDARGTRIGRLVVLRDVTREREVDQLKSTLMQTVSHELRTPLASVVGYTELLRTRRLDADSRAEILGTVHREAKRLSSLIDDFLDLQTIEEQRLELSLAPFDVGALLAESVAVFGGQSEAHTLVLLPCEQPVVAVGDRARVAQVIANLLSNAIKYSPDGGTVRVSAQCGEGVVRISVADEGLGIPLAAQPRVFEKFFRVAREETVRVAGSGLGLALAHDIVVAHGGEMGFESVEGDGSTFWFTLPTA
ncbi:HAMP domain-containing protein [Solirubrobacter sp. CPCC 204708]|uniref:histidine kinase n=1 Tax=Solirubrobacter deserti TaxID=2282478 RepID=A0ABT4RH32_9ACTN|nr:ATP-binding protein [Solirubrobacter deserti]MBE2315321.1 HAMP domain-containing protein [Solirubrobacter deserti]MDA0137834.1 ATP-binding protein [Solirubrobacter deserti]